MLLQEFWFHILEDSAESFLGNWVKGKQHCLLYILEKLSQLYIFRYLDSL